MAKSLFYRMVLTLAQAILLEGVFPDMSTICGKLFRALT
jgi:hypothetical protein